MMLLGLALAILIGGTLGLLGGGGSILAVPVFVYVLGLEERLAIATSLAVVGGVSIAGMISHARKGNVDLRSGLLFAVGSSIGAIAGSSLASLVSGGVQLTAFAVMMLVTAVMMLRGKRSHEASDGEGTSGRRLALTIAASLGVGVLTGFVGAGGGFVIVPALVLLLGTDMKRATGTSLMVIALNSAWAFANYLRQDQVREGLARTTIGDLSLTTYLLLFTALAIVGVLGGSALSKRVPAARLRVVFGLFLIVVAVGMLVQRVVG